MSGSNKKPCRNFANGRCTFGSRCHYSHQTGGGHAGKDRMDYQGLIVLENTESDVRGLSGLDPKGMKVTVAPTAAAKRFNSYWKVKNFPCTGSGMDIHPLAKPFAAALGLPIELSGPVTFFRVKLSLAVGAHSDTETYWAECSFTGPGASPAVKWYRGIDGRSICRDIFLRKHERERENFDVPAVRVKFEPSNHPCAESEVNPSCVAALNKLLGWSGVERLRNGEFPSSVGVLVDTVCQMGAVVYAHINALVSCRQEFSFSGHDVTARLWLQFGVSQPKIGQSGVCNNLHVFEVTPFPRSSISTAHAEVQHCISAVVRGLLSSIESQEAVSLSPSSDGEGQASPTRSGRGGYTTRGAGKETASGASRGQHSEESRGPLVAGAAGPGPAPSISPGSIPDAPLREWSQAQVAAALGFVSPLPDCFRCSGADLVECFDDFSVLHMSELCGSEVTALPPGQLDLISQILSAARAN